jgi:hypothetical protein
MGDIVNLRKVRKQAERQRDEQQAAANRHLHGRSKAERERDTAQRTRALRDLDRHRIETGDER